MTTVTPEPETAPADPEESPRRRKKLRIALIAALVLTPILAWLAFGYFGVQFLFIDDKVDEANPFATSAAAVADDPAPPAAEGDADDVDPSAGQGEAIPSDPETDPAGEPTVVTLAGGDFEGRAHPTSGTASVITDGSDARFLRFEDFATDNGPDLNVYLVADGDVDNGFIDLGNLKGNIGNQNYELDADVDLSVYDTVVIWCVRFSVSFGDAALTLA
ncbi:MAG: DM13 domain-containing protein [Acidimicrobiales bacterium]